MKTDVKSRATAKSSAVVAQAPRARAYGNDVQRVNARLDAATAAKLKEVTAGEGIGVTEALKRAVGLLHSQFQIDRQRKLRRPILESMIGKYSSGLGDLAENHKAYYAQAIAEKYGHHR